MTTTDTAVLTAPITFAGRTMETTAPTAAQRALLIDAQDWFTRAVKEGSKQPIPDDAPADHPARLAATAHINRGIVHVARLQKIIGSLFADPDDWDYIQDQMAAGKIEWPEIAGLVATIQSAHNDADEMVETNRTAKRRGRRTT